MGSSCMKKGGGGRHKNRPEWQSLPKRSSPLRVLRAAAETRAGEECVILSDVEPESGAQQCGPASRFASSCSS